MNRLSTHSLIASSADGEVTLEELAPARQQQAERTHGDAEIGLDAEQPGRQHPRQVPVALRIEQGRRHPQGERPEAPAQSTTSTRKAFVTASNVAHGHDFVGPRAAGSGHVDDVALGFADEGARNGR